MQIAIPPNDAQEKHLIMEKIRSSINYNNDDGSQNPQNMAGDGGGPESDNFYDDDGSSSKNQKSGYGNGDESNKHYDDEHTAGGE